MGKDTGLRAEKSEIFRNLPSLMLHIHRENRIMEKEQIINRLKELVSSSLEFGLDELKKIVSQSSIQYSTLLTIYAAFQSFKKDKLNGIIDYGQKNVTEAQLVERTLSFISNCTLADFKFAPNSDSKSYFDLKLIESRLQNLENSIKVQTDKLQEILDFFETNPPNIELLDWWNNLSLGWIDVFSAIIGHRPNKSDIEHLLASKSLKIFEKKIFDDYGEVINVHEIGNLGPLRHFSKLEWLNIDGCQVISLEPIRELPIKELIIGDAPIISLRPIWDMKSLKLIGLSNDNSLDEDELDEFKESHRRCHFYEV